MTNSLTTAAGVLHPSPRPILAFVRLQDVFVQPEKAQQMASSARTEAVVPAPLNKAPPDAASNAPAPAPQTKAPAEAAIKAPPPPPPPKAQVEASSSKAPGPAAAAAEAEAAEVDPTASIAQKLSEAIADAQVWPALKPRSGNVQDVPRGQIYVYSACTDNAHTEQICMFCLHQQRTLNTTACLGPFRT
eukprot:365030-Chlamydomonas_euryale.AAC.2